MENKMKTWIFDIDGTLANIEHRRKYVSIKPKNWAAFNAGMMYDTINPQVVDLLHLIQTDPSNYVVISSGRGEESRRVTEDWLAKYNISFQKLYMRSTKDNRRDDIVKEEMLAKMISDGFKPYAVIDDRPQVVRMWRKNGLFVFDVNQSGEEF